MYFDIFHISRVIVQWLVVFMVLTLTVLYHSQNPFVFGCAFVGFHYTFLVLSIAQQTSSAFYHLRRTHCVDHMVGKTIGSLSSLNVLRYAILLVSVLILRRMHSDTFFETLFSLLDRKNVPFLLIYLYYFLHSLCTMISHILHLDCFSLDASDEPFNIIQFLSVSLHHLFEFFYLNVLTYFIDIELDICFDHLYLLFVFI